MASRYSQIEVPFPVTLNTDLSASQLKPEESPDLRNVITAEPGQLRVRRGFNRTVQFFSTMTEPRNSVLTGVQQIGQRVALSYNMFTGGQLRDEWLPRYHYTRDITGLDINEGASKVVILDAGSPNSTAWTVNGQVDPSTTGALGASYAGRMNAVIGRTVNYNGFSYGATSRAIWRRTRETNETTQQASLGEGLVRWSGHNPSTMNYSVLATAVNGSKAVTLAVDPTAGGSLVGSIMRLNTGGGITAAEAPRVTGWFTYRVESHSGTSVTLDRAYGLGEPTTVVPNLTSELVTFTAESDVANCPLGVQCVEVFRDRIFTGRANLSPAVGQYAGYYANMINWSEPGEPEKWPAQNFIIVDDEFDDPIMGLATVGSVMLVFKRHKTYILSGTDEASFAVDKFLDRVGCIYSGSIAAYEDKVVWAAEDGIYAFDGETLEELTQPEPHRGIKKKYISRMRKDNENNDKYYTRFPMIHANGDYLMVALADLRHEQNDAALVYNYRDKTWVEFGRRLSDGNINANLTANDIMFKGWFSQNDVTYGILDWQILNVEKCLLFEQEAPVTTTTFDYTDRYYDSTNTTQFSLTTAVVQVPDIRFGDGDTARIKEIAVDHNAHYASAVLPAAMVDAWTLQVGVDSDLDTVDKTYFPQARATLSPSPPNLVPQYNRYYQDRFPDTWSLEGEVVRLTFTASGLGNLLSRKLFRVRLLIEPVKTRLNRNQ